VSDTQSIISQYLVQHQKDELTTVGKLCRSIEAETDIDPDFAEFFRAAWDINTAVGVWLDYWGVWVGVGRYLSVSPSGETFGFASDSGTLNNSVFAGGGSGDGSYRLTDKAFRKLILLKAYANIAGCSIKVLNECLLYFFDGRRVYASDNFDMTCSINFEFELSEWEYALITQSNAFPKAAGVQYLYTFYTAGFFGFAPDSGTLNNSTFRN